VTALGIASVSPVVFLGSALFIAAPTIAFVIVRVVRRRRLKPEPEPIFWSEMEPGKRYRIEMWVEERFIVDFTDEFVCYTHAFSKARFVGRTVERMVSDRVRVTPA
jgi:hypothetical protein